MRTKNIFTLLFTFALLASCGEKVQERSVEKAIESGNVEELKAMKAELSNKQHNLAEQLDQISKEISKLDTNKKFPLVTAFSVSPKQFEHFIEVQAGFNTEKNVVVYAEFSGMLTDVLVKEGQQVNKGQLIAKIDDGGISQQLIQAEVQAELSKTTFEKQKRLWNQDIGSEMQYLQAKADYEAKQKMVEQIQKQLGKTRIEAPFSGVIDEILIEEGNMVSPGMSGVVRLLNLDQMYARADVPEVYIQSVEKGKLIDVFVPVLNDSLEAEISQVNHYISPDNRTFKVEARVKNENWKIKPNMNAKLKIADYVADSALLVPKNIISEDASGKKYLFVANKKDGMYSVAEKQFVDLGLAEGNYYEVKSGLKAGDIVIDEGARIVLDGQKVEILK
ncbi:MAG: efflux RND transporter periplasmic adaptor subunit [Vicingaceae bacterium]